jgi:HlyD family secretion protein
MYTGNRVMSRIFRQEALERLSSPEQLDQMMQVVNPKHWLALVTFVVLVIITLIWAWIGRLPTTVTGQGVLIYPRKVVDVQSPASGRLKTLSVRVGDVVRTGDVLGLIDQAEIRQELQEEHNKLQELLSQDQTKSALQGEHVAVQTQQTHLEAEAIALQRRDLLKRLQDAQAKTPILQQRWDNRKRLEGLGLIPKFSDERLQAEQAYHDNQDQIAAFQSELKQLESQLKQLDSQRASLTLENLDTRTSRQNEIQDLRSHIALLDLQLQENSQIISQHDGRILELTVHVGQVIQAGGRLGSIEIVDAASELVGLTYFPIKAGKKIKPGMMIQVAPDAVERERYGSILGTVTSVSAFPVTKEGASSLVGNSEVAEFLVAQRPAIEVVAQLTQDDSTFSGYQWSSSQGPTLRITSGTTTLGRVVIEQRAPITYLLPLLREISGLY